MSMIPTIVITGRPNVGKSTLFNRLVGRRRAIVHDRPGVTRDRISETLSLEGGQARLVDTGGFLVEESDVLDAAVLSQIDQAMKEADLLLVVVDGREGLTYADEIVVKRARETGTKSLLVINKADPGSKKEAFDEFLRLGMSEVFEVSAEHSIGVESLREALGLELKGKLLADVESEPDRETSKIAFIGRPNVGKSSLINAILNEPRLAVTEIAGTTRDVVDVEAEVEGHRYLLLDTAGIRRKFKVQDGVEKVSAATSFRSVERADVIILVLDATSPMTTQDERIVALALEQGKGFCVAANKWDLVRDSQRNRQEFREELYLKAPFLSFAVVRFVSAKTGMSVDTLLNEAKAIHRRQSKFFEPAKLKEVFRLILGEHPPKGKRSHRIRLSGLSQDPDFASRFFVWCNDPRWIDPSYERYWTNALQEHCQMKGLPLRVIFRRKRGSSKSSQGRR